MSRRVPAKRLAVLAVASLLLTGGFLPGADSTVVFNEIMYHPVADEPTMEWLELHNQMAVNMDLSGWRVAGGIDYTFPEGTVVPAKGYAVLALSPETLEVATGLTGILGPFTGRLENAGETLELRNNSNRLMDRITYNDTGRWPVAADGSGVSLAKLDPNGASGLAAGWAASVQIGGTPGAVNFPSADDPGALRQGLVSFWACDDEIIGAGTYTENFQEPDGAPQDWMIAGGSVSIASGQLRLQAGGSETWTWAGKSGASESFGAIRAVSAKVHWQTIPGDNIGRHGGIMVCASEPGTRYTANGYVIDWIDRESDRGYRIYKAVGGEHEMFVPGSGHTSPAAVWRVEFDATSFKFIADGVEIGRWTDSDFRAGCVGAWCYSNAGEDLRIDDVQVEYGGAARDSADGNTGVAGSNVTLVAGLVGPGALSFDNTAEAYIDVGPGTNDNFAARTGITIEALLSPAWTGALGDYDTIFRKEDGDNRILLGFQHDGITATRDVALAPATQPVLSFGLNAGGVYRELDMPLDGLEGRPTLAAFKTGMHHVVATYDSVSGIKAFYVDGIRCFSTTYPAGRLIASGGAARATFGNSADHGEPFKGVIDEVTFWSRALAADEVTLHYTNALAGDNYFVPAPVTGQETALVVFNETYVTVADSWIELVNVGGIAFDLTGAAIGSQGTVTGTYTFGSRVLASGAFLTLTEAQLGFDLAEGNKLFLYSADRSEVLAAVTLRQHGRARSPDGTGLWYVPDVTTPGAANHVTLQDAVVINEIMYHPMDDADERGEYVELFNRGAAEVDLSGWSFDNGLVFTFQEGTVLPAGGYLVVAVDPAYLRTTYGIDNVVGPYVGRLANDDERIELVDQAGNTVDEVRYYDSWAPWADAGGSSLELRNARAVRAHAGAWAASDEGAKAQWQTYTYRATAASDRGPTQWNEFVFGLLDEGTVLLDDIHVIERPASAPLEFIQNSTFETGAAKWRFLGTHRHAEVIVDPDNAGNHVLLLAASGETEHMHNHVETTFANSEAVVDGRQYEISFRAKWLGGCNLLHTRLYFNRAAKTNALALPARRGTPGRVNSTAVANLGPTWGAVRHQPVVPQPAEAVTVFAEAADPDGVAQALVWWSVNGGAWQSAAMTARDGEWRGTIPGAAAGATIQFYLEALDLQGAGSYFPAAGPDSRALIRVEDGQARLEKLHNVRIIMTQADADFLHLATNVMSNDRLGATVLYDEKEIFYDVGVRLKSSQRGRLNDARVGFNISFSRDHMFRGVHKTVSADRAGGWGLGIASSHDEILIKHIANHAGYIPTMYDDIAYVIAPRRTHTRSALLLMANYNSRFLDGQWENGSAGDQYKYELIYYPTSTDNGTAEGLKLPQPDNVTGVDLQDMGNDKEAYRWFFLNENNVMRDDWSGIIKVCKAFSAPSLQLEAAARDAMDVSEWMRVFTLYALCGINDTYMYGNYHNNTHYVRPSDGKVLVFPWDMDWSWSGSASDPLWGSMNLQRIIQLTPYLRMYYGHFKDIITTTYNRTYMDPWIQHYGSVANQNYGAVSTYIQGRAANVLGRLPSGINFEITTHGGTDFSVGTETTTLEGNAPVEIAALLLNDAEVAPTWSTTTHWSWSVALRPGLNQLTFTGRDVHGATVGTAAINVTSTVNWDPPIVDALVPFEGSTLGGTEVNLYGAKLKPGLRVWFGAAESPSVTLLSSVQARAVTPPGSVGQVDVRAENLDGGFVIASIKYRYMVVIVPPEVQTLVPLQGSTLGGTEVDLYGANLQPGLRVWFGAAEAQSVTLVSTVQAHVVTPPGTGQVDVRAENLDGGAAVADVKFTYILIPPQVQAFTPLEGSTLGGTTVELAGTNFLAGLRVWFGTAESASVTVVSPTLARAVTPAGTGQVAVRVENTNGGTATAATQYTYVEVPVGTNFIRGDANADGKIDISDAIKILGYLFALGNVQCLDALDVNDDGNVNIADAINLLGYNFAQGAPPLPPFEECGLDPSNDTVDCAAFTACPNGR